MEKLDKIHRTNVGDPLMRLESTLQAMMKDGHTYILAATYKNGRYEYAFQIIENNAQLCYSIATNPDSAIYNAMETFLPEVNR